MSYQVKKTVVSVGSGVLLLAAYCFYAFGKLLPGMAEPGDLKVWASTMLIFIGIGIVASIIIQIVFHILLSIAVAIKKHRQDGTCDDQEIEKSINLDMVEDEMDKLIGLKAMRVSFVIAGVGFIAALVSLVLHSSTAVMLNIFFISFSVGSISEGVAQLYYYMRGIRYGQ